MKIRTERIECYWARGTGKTRDYHFYVDFPRNATKAEEVARKEFAKFIKGRDGTEGRGYNWRVSVATLRAALDFLPDPKAIKAEMERFDAEGVRPPTEPYHVSRLDVYSTDIPNVVSLTFDEVPERFRRACEYWKTTHRLKKDEYQHVSLFGGRSITITQDMLITFESWLLFDKPWRELHAEALAKRKIDEDEQRARMYASDAPFRAKYPDWDQWTNKAQNEERYKAFEESDEWKEYVRKFKREYQREHIFSFSSTSKVREAFALFELPDSSTLQDVKKRYRSLAKRSHPDVGGDEETFKKLNAANQVLVQHLS